MERRTTKSRRTATTQAGKLRGGLWGLVGIAGTLTLLAGALIWAQTTTPLADGAEMMVYKSSTCGCCNKWVDHLRDAGFAVKTQDRSDMGMVKSSYGVDRRLWSCHTAVVGGYVVEGHVPADDIKRLLVEKPAVTGLAVPRMPIGSPGMEIEGVPPDAYEVFAFTRNGEFEVFATH